MNSAKTSTLEACASLIVEHREMEVLLDRLEALLRDLPDGQTLEKHQWPALDEQMAVIAKEMDVHFACEEESLFPAVEPYHPMVLMEVEHEELMGYRDAILEFLRLERLAPPEVDELKKVGTSLVEELRDHIGREDAGIFPTCERALSDDEKREVIEGMDRIRAKAREGDVPVFSRPERTFDMFNIELDGALERPVSVRTLGESSNMLIKELNIKAGGSLAPHWSPRQHTMVCLQGNGMFISSQGATPLKDGALISDGRELPFQAGSVIRIDAQLLHSIQAVSDCRFVILAQTI